MRALHVVVAVLVVLGASAAEPLVIPIGNGGFDDGWVDHAAAEEARVGGAIADGWGDNSSWADVHVRYAIAPDPHGGTGAQQITVTRVASGYVQYVRKVALEAGHAYAFSLWMRGKPGDAVSLMLRELDSPWTSFAEVEAPLSAEWREYVVEGAVTKSCEGVLMVRFSSPMQVALDDAQLLDITAATGDAAPRIGNLIAGGSFEAGMPFGWSTRVQGHPRWEALDPRPTTDDGASVDGAYSYRMTLPSGQSAQLWSPVFHPNPQRPHAVSLWLKADPPASVRIEIERTSIATDVGVGAEWQKVTFAGTMPFLRWSRLRLSFRAPDAAQPTPTAQSLWVDAVQVEEADSPSAEYRPTAPYELALAIDRPGSVVFDGELVAAAVRIAPTPPAGARLRLRLRDIFGAVHDLPPVTLPIPALLLPDLAERPRGVFTLDAVIESAEGESLSAPVALVWARLPRPRAIDPKDSYFGIHIPLAPDHIALAAACGMRWVRLHDASMLTKWPFVEVEQGRFEFPDAGVDAANAAGVAVLGMLDGAPSWTSSAPREGYWGIWNQPDLPEAPVMWEGYVRAITSHYRGRIAAWEVWNEPWGQWWTGAGGTPERYAELLAIAYRTTRECDPAALIVGVDTYRGSDAWHDGVLASAKLDAFDAFSFHDYNDALYGGPDALPRLQAEMFNAAQARHGAPKPLWNTEGGALAMASSYAPETGGMEARRQLAQGVRYDVTMMAAGVKRFCHYAVFSGAPMGDLAGVEHDRAIKPLLAGRAVLAALVDGAGVPTRDEPQPGCDVYAYPARDGWSVRVAWSYDGDAHALAVPAGARVLDIMGNVNIGIGEVVELGVEPVYLVVPAP